MQSFRHNGPARNGRSNRFDSSNVLTIGSRESLNELTLWSLLKKIDVHSWTWASVGALLGLGGGIVAPLVGLVLTAVAWFTGPYWHGFPLHRAGTVLCGLTFFLLFLGAHCLDLMEQHDGKVSVKKTPENNALCAA
jgi:hypothetical protein